MRQSYDTFDKNKNRSVKKVGKDQQKIFNPQSQNIGAANDFEADRIVVGVIQCPVCDQNCSTVHGHFRHVVDIHNLQDYDQNFYCQRCDYYTSNIDPFLNHLFKDHLEYDTMSKKYYYYESTLQIKYYKSQRGALAAIVRGTSLYTRITEQGLVIQKLDKNIFLHNSKKEALLLRQKQNVFVRGSTEIKYTEFGILCPICSKDGFENLKKLATHIRACHYVRIPNLYYCPHCNKDFKSLTALANHLIQYHSTKDDYGELCVYELDGSHEKYMPHEITFLSKAIQNYMIYHTFFNPNAKYKPEQ